MLVKRYHANDMQQAMDTVIRELGSDAVILNSRKVRKKGWKNLFRKPILEVMVAYDPANVPAVKKLNFAPSAPYYAIDPPKEQGSMQALVGAGVGASMGAGMGEGMGAGAGAGMGASMGGSSAEGMTLSEAMIMAESTMNDSQLERLDSRIESIDSMLNEFIEKFSFVKRDITYDYDEEVQELVQKMIENQVREELAHSLAKETENLLRNQPGTSATEVLEHLILERIGKPAPILHKKFSQKVILVMGPTGVGKTTTIVKLAAEFAVKQKKKIGIINTDTFRIGAQEQLQTYADIMGIPLQVVYQTGELEAAMEYMSDRDVIFVDTAGKRPGDEQHKEDILDIVRILKPEDILLCMAATTGFSAIKEMVDTYGFVEDYRLLITKLDETKYRGVLLNISWYTQKQIAYVTTGQNVPDDIEVVNVEAVAKQVISG